MNDKEIQQKFIQFLAKKSGAKTQQQLEEYIKRLGEDGLKKAKEEFTKEMQKQKVKAAHGAKLNYIKSLKHQCAEDEELYYYKRGGAVGCGCIKKNEEGGKTPQKKKNPVKAFKDKKATADLATRDSIAINKYGAEDLESIRPGTYKKSPDGKKVIWVPDRTKHPYKKEKGGIVDKFINTAGKVLSTMSNAGWTAAKVTSGYYEKPKPKKKEDSQQPVKKYNAKDDKGQYEVFTPKKTKPSPNSKINRGGTKSKIEHMHGGSKVVTKFKKHRQGGSLNGIPFYQAGTPKGGINQWTFSERPVYSGNGYGIKHHWIYQNLVNGKSQGDFPPTVAGRTIYFTPYRNDTLYWRNLDSDQDFLFEKTPTKSKDQESAKQNFYRWTKKS